MVISQDVGCERSYVFFFFQAEDGIRDLTVTGVQTCALPIYGRDVPRLACHGPPLRVEELHREPERLGGGRSEEHTSELQSQSNLVCRLLLEKKKMKAQPTARPQRASGHADRVRSRARPHQPA